jgi:hypothetical protein
LGEVAHPALRAALAARPSEEFRRRAEQLLEGPPSRERLRTVRALEVLEHVGTAEARAVFAALAQGAPAARLTREAQSALERLAGRLRAP